MDKLDKLRFNIKKNFETNLSIIGDELCKEIEALLSDDLDFMKMKAHFYSNFYIKRYNPDPILKDKCDKYLSNFCYYENL